MDGWMDGWTDGWMDRWVDGWMDRQMDGWLDGQMEGWVDRWAGELRGQTRMKTSRAPHLPHPDFAHPAVLSHRRSQTLSGRLSHSPDAAKSN